MDDISSMKDLNRTAIPILCNQLCCNGMLCTAENLSFEKAGDSLPLAIIQRLNGQIK